MGNAHIIVSLFVVFDKLPISGTKTNSGTIHNKFIDNISVRIDKAVAHDRYAFKDRSSAISEILHVR